MSAATCPWCQAPRAEGPNCPKCGANYAKAEAIRKGGRAAATPAAAPEAPMPEAKAVWQSSFVDDPDTAVDSQLEWKLCAAAIPASLAIAVVMHLILPGLQRIVFGMPVHELGHAVVAWLCGYAAIPTLWITHVPESPGFAAPLVLGGAMAYCIWRAWQAEKWTYIALCAGVLVLLGIGTFGLKERTAQMLITFGGDGVGMILAALLMASFFFGKGTQLYQGSVRWGLVFIGAAAFVDMFAVWWGSRTDRGLLPFGEQERAGHSDATRLTEAFGWSDDQLIQRHVTVGVVSLMALALVYAWGVWRAWRYAQAAGK